MIGDQDPRKPSGAREGPCVHRTLNWKPTSLGSGPTSLGSGSSLPLGLWGLRKLHRLPVLHSLSKLSDQAITEVHSSLEIT